jgi:hypothetical protein
MPLPILHHVERSTSYVPPSFAIRFLRSLLTLSLFALPGLVAAFLLAARRFDRRFGRAIAVWAVIVLAGAFVAATDAINDEGWNPTFYGGPFVAMSLPAAIAMAASGDDSRRTSMIVLAIIAAFPFALLVSGLGSAFVQWAFDHGIPLTW